MSAVGKLARLRPGVRGYTVADLHALPEDGPRYELIDGSIIVSPSATGSHDMFARWIAQLLDEANPGTDYVVGTDQSVTIDDHNELRPDIVVYPSAYLDDSPFSVAGVQLDGATYRYSEHYATQVFRTERPWPVEIDLPALATRMAGYRRPSTGTS